MERESSSRARLCGVVFDFDGVIADSEPYHYGAILEAVRPHGVEFSYEHYLDRYIGFDDRDAFREAFREARIPLGDEELERLLQSKFEAFKKLATKGVEPLPGALELIQGLAGRRLPLAIATGATAREVRMMLDGLGVAELFPVMVTADDVEQSKPHPETYLRAVKRLGSLMSGPRGSSPCCVAIEDTPAGIRSAKDAGLPVIAVATTHDRSRLAEADQVFDDLSSLSIETVLEIVGSAERSAAGRS
jgi:HAD superfamily hydrolase (TIGR01509 family)